MTNERPRPASNKYSVGDAEDLAFAASVNDALRPYGAKVNPAVATFPDGTMEWRLVAESGSKRRTLRSPAPFHKVEGAVAKITGEVQNWLSGAGASKDGLVGKRWGVATSDDDFM
jgi:hypothetical protein